MKILLQSASQNVDEKICKFFKNQNLLPHFHKELHKDAWHKKLDPETQILFWREVKNVWYIQFLLLREVDFELFSENMMKYDENLLNLLLTNKIKKILAFEQKTYIIIVRSDSSIKGCFTMLDTLKEILRPRHLASGSKKCFIWLIIHWFSMIFIGFGDIFRSKSSEYWTEINGSIDFFDLFTTLTVHRITNNDSISTSSGANRIYSARAIDCAHLLCFSFEWKNRKNTKQVDDFRKFRFRADWPP